MIADGSKDCHHSPRANCESVIAIIEVVHKCLIGGL